MKAMPVFPSVRTGESAPNLRTISLFGARRWTVLEIGTCRGSLAGAAAGAGVVAAASVATPRPVLAIPPESQMDFYLAAPISVQPVSAKEAEQLAQRMHPGAPVLYVRGDTP